MGFFSLLKKDSNQYNIMVVTKNSASMKSFKVYHNTIRLAILSTIALFVALIAWGTYMTLRPNHSNQFGALTRDNLELENKLAEVRTKVVLMENNLDRLERFDKKLRVMTNFVDHRRKIAMGPLGDEEMSLSEIEGSSHINEALALKLSAKLKGLESANLSDEIDRLLSQSEKQEEDVAELINFLEDQQLLLAHVPSIKPSEGWLTSGFGYRINPFTGVRKHHDGLDIANNIGTPIHAPANGTVIYTGTRSAYGKVMVINHGFGLTTRFAHLSEYFASVGDKVERGMKIAAVGNTGRSTGPHLHYEVRVNNIPRNPLRYIIE